MKALRSQFICEKREVSDFPLGTMRNPNTSVCLEVVEAPVFLELYGSVVKLLLYFLAATLRHAPSGSDLLEVFRIYVKGNFAQMKFD